MLFRSAWLSPLHSGSQGLTTNEESGVAELRRRSNVSKRQTGTPSQFIWHSSFVRLNLAMTAVWEWRGRVLSLKLGLSLEDWVSSDKAGHPVWLIINGHYCIIFCVPYGRFGKIQSTFRILLDL